MEVQSERIMSNIASPPPTAVRTGRDANIDTEIRAQPIILSAVKITDDAEEVLLIILFMSETAEITAKPAKQAAAI